MIYQLKLLGVVAVACGLMVIVFETLKSWGTS